ncbi:MAG: hypothetical protein IKO72_02630 [Kiritimatiellae bacterium]|nr:hypothetical protein [Kiritimatiellia bacterium]
MKRLFTPILFFPFLSGCFLYDCGYTRNDDTAIYKTDSSNKMPISYSLKFDTCFPANDAPGTPTVKSIKAKIDEALKETGLFSEVSYGNRDDKGYHIEFTYNDSGFSYDEAYAKAFVYVYTLFMIPIPENYSADMSAIVYLEGKPIWSVAHTEKCRYIVCWYALPAGLVFNYWSVWRSIEYNIVRSTINDFTREHIRRYLDPNFIELTNPEDAGVVISPAERK